jgi:hypothetical protein
MEITEQHRLSGCCEIPISLSRTITVRAVPLREISSYITLSQPGDSAQEADFLRLVVISPDAAKLDNVTDDDIEQIAEVAGLLNDPSASRFIDRQMKRLEKTVEEAERNKERARALERASIALRPDLQSPLTAPSGRS